MDRNIVAEQQANIYLQAALALLLRDLDQHLAGLKQTDRRARRARSRCPVRLVSRLLSLSSRIHCDMSSVALPYCFA